MQVQHQRLCRGARETSRGSRCPCLCYSSCHWGETSPTQFDPQAFLVAGGSKDGQQENFLSTVLMLLPGARAWTDIASLPGVSVGIKNISRTKHNSFSLVGVYSHPLTSLFLKCFLDSGGRASNVRGMIWISGGLHGLVEVNE